MANDFVMSLGAHWVQSDGESFFEAVGTEVDLGPKELSDQGAGVALYINRRLWAVTFRAITPIWSHQTKRKF